MATFGETLKGLREKAGLTQQELADRSGTSQKAISFWEKDEREPALSNVQKLCAALGVDCTVFFEAGDVKPAPGPVHAAKRSSAKPTRSEKGEAARTGIGIYRSDEAINFLTRLRRDDPLREQALDKVLEFIRSNQAAPLVKRGRAPQSRQVPSAASADSIADGAIACLASIPRNDPHRSRAFERVKHHVLRNK